MEFTQIFKNPIDFAAVLFEDTHFFVSFSYFCFICLVLPYEVTVTTGDLLNAGTDADVFLQLYGEDGKSEEMKLHNKTDNFERKAVDKFKVLLNKIIVYGYFSLQC